MKPGQHEELNRRDDLQLKPSSRARESLRFLAFVLLLLFALFPKVFCGMETFFYRDYGALGYPYGFFLHDSILHGELPLWNPYSHCGVPFLAQWGTLYPSAWLAVLLPMPWGNNLLMLLHLAFAGMGMYWLARRFEMSPLAASLAGLAYTFNGISLSCLLWGNYIASLCWLPWVVGCVMQSWKSGGRWIVLAALTSALQVLTATPELTLLTWLIIGVLWLAESFSRKAPYPSSFVRLLTVIILAASITMVQMLPFFGLLHNAQRTASYGGHEFAMPGWGLANLFVPLFHCYKAPDGVWFQSDQDFLGSYYLGISLLVLAGVGVWLKRTSTALSLGLAALFCWVMAMGENGGVYSAVRHALPMIGFARFPVKFLIPTGFIVALLAGWAIDALPRIPKRVGRSVLFAAAISLALVGLLLWTSRIHPLQGDEWSATATNACWRILIMVGFLGSLFLSLKIPSMRIRSTVQFALLLLIPLDALTHSPGMMPTLSSGFLSSGIWEASGKPPPPRFGEGRIMLTPQAEDHLLRSAATNHQADFTGKRLAEWLNLNLIDRIPKVNGAMTLRPAHFDALERYLYFTAGTKFGYGLADFLSAAWISSPVNPVLWVQRTNYLPLITAGQKPIFVNDEEALKRLTDLEFNPRNSVFLDEAANPSVSVTNNADIFVQAARFRLNEVSAEIQASQAGMVVLSQTYYHLWKAYVDEQSTPIFRANLAFQAIQVPAGKHQIRLTYHDPNLVAGAFISLLGLGICLLLWIKNPPLKSEGSSEKG